MLDTTFALVSAPALVAALLAVPLPERAAVALDLEPIVCISEAATDREGLSQGCDPFALDSDPAVEGCTVAGIIAGWVHEWSSRRDETSAALDAHVRDLCERYDVSRRDVLEAEHPDTQALMWNAEGAYHAQRELEDEFPHLAAWGLHTGDATTDEVPPPVHPDLELTWGPEDDLPF